MDSSSSSSSEHDDSSSSLDIDTLNEELQAVLCDEEYEARQDFCETMMGLRGDDGGDDSEEENELLEHVIDELVVTEREHKARGGGGSEHEWRVQDSIKFCTERLSGVRLTKYERDYARCEPEFFEEARRRRLGLGDPHHPHDEMLVEQQQQQHCGTKLLCETPLTADEKKKKVFTVSMKGTSLLFIIENYVHVTYFVNSLTGDLCKFSLRDLANKLLDYYVEYSCKKFAKVNLRYHDGLSFLLYTSSVLVETGSDNQLLSRRLLQHVVTILREKCGYPHINIKRRKCQNIVATGKLSYHICMNVLKHQFQAVHEKDGFAGLVIKHRDLVKFFQARDNGDTGYECVATPNYVSDDDDSAIIALINSVNERKQCVPTTGSTAGATAGRAPGIITNEYGEEEDEEKAFQRITKLIDEYDPRMNSTRLNGTSILFHEGHIICTGCKTDQELVSLMALLKRLTYMCSDTNPKNRSMELSLAAQKKAHQ
jgi:TATA-box binding protein (TBP) (component of TFIID and TFIIIB)